MLVQRHKKNVHTIRLQLKSHSAQGIGSIIGHHAPIVLLAMTVSSPTVSPSTITSTKQAHTCWMARLATDKRNTTSTVSTQRQKFCFSHRWEWPHWLQAELFVLPLHTHSGPLLEAAWHCSQLYTLVAGAHSPLLHTFMCPSSVTLSCLSVRV